MSAAMALTLAGDLGEIYGEICERCRGDVWRLDDGGLGGGEVLHALLLEGTHLRLHLAHLLLLHRGDLRLGDVGEI